MDFFKFSFIFQELRPDKLFQGWFLLNFYEKLIFFINCHVIYHFSRNVLQILEILTENKHFYHLRVQIKNQVSWKNAKNANFEYFYGYILKIYCTWLLNAFIMFLMFLTVKNLFLVSGNPLFSVNYTVHNLLKFCSVNALLWWILPFIVTIFIDPMKVVNTVAISSYIFYVTNVPLISCITVLPYHNTKVIYF